MLVSRFISRLLTLRPVSTFATSASSFSALHNKYPLYNPGRSRPGHSASSRSWSTRTGRNSQQTYWLLWVAMWGDWSTVATGSSSLRPKHCWKRLRQSIRPRSANAVIFHLWRRHLSAFNFTQFEESGLQFRQLRQRQELPSQQIHVAVTATPANRSGSKWFGERLQRVHLLPPQGEKNAHWQAAQLVGAKHGQTG